MKIADQYAIAALSCIQSGDMSPQQVADKALDIADAIVRAKKKRAQTSSTQHRLAELIRHAVISGSEYWAKYYRVGRYVNPHVEVASDEYDLLCLEGGSFLVCADDPYGACEEGSRSFWTVDLEVMMEGLEAFSRTAEYKEWCRGRSNSVIGDVYLQCCIFGEVAYK